MTKEILHQFICKAIVSMALLFCIKSSAQTADLGSWSVFSAKYLLYKNAYILFDGQIRSQQLYTNFNFVGYQSSFGYKFKKNGSALLGIGEYETYQSEGNFKSPHIANEFRIWEQLILNNTINRLKIEHRFRLEQRFNSLGYRNRIRYRLNAIYPINKITIQKNTWYLSVYNEFFLNNEDVYFEQNRAYVGIGYQINNRLTIQSGILKNFLNVGSNAQTSKTFLQTILLFNLNELKSFKENIHIH